MRTLHRRPTVYRAGPTVFYPEPDSIFSQMKPACARHGLQGVAPLDNQIGLEGVAPDGALTRIIVLADIELMRQVDAGIFCLDGFRRGPEMDPGTAIKVAEQREKAADESAAYHGSTDWVVNIIGREQHFDIEPGEIADVEGRYPANAMDVHGGHQSRVMHLGSTHLMLRHRALPFPIHGCLSGKSVKASSILSTSAAAIAGEKPRPLPATGRVSTFQNSAIFCGVT